MAVGVRALGFGFGSAAGQAPVDVPKSFGDAMPGTKRPLAPVIPPLNFISGSCIRRACGFEQDPVEAARWYERAAHQGHVQAQYNLAMMHHKGEGISQDFGQARHWYGEAARQGLAEAAYSLGMLYDLGLGTPRDVGVAAEWYGRATARGYALAQNNLAILYAKGDGVERDPARALVLYRAAAVAGLAEAQFNWVLSSSPATESSGITWRRTCGWTWRHARRTAYRPLWRAGRWSSSSPT